MGFIDSSDANKCLQQVELPEMLDKMISTPQGFDGMDDRVILVPEEFAAGC